MKKFQYISLVFLFLIYLPCSAQNAQQSKVPGVNREFYVVEVRGLLSEEQANQLDKTILADQHFVKCSTDYKGNTIYVVAQKGIRIEDVKHFTSQFNLVITRYTEEYSDKNIEDWNTENKNKELNK